MIKVFYISPIPKNINPTEALYRKVLHSNIELFRRRDREKDDSLNFNFSGYENQLNKRKIRSITKGRCGYCGARTTDTSQLEIEHFRPKKRLDIRSNEFILHSKSNHKLANGPSGIVRHGYFKFGNDYRNLLPSCSVCNKGLEGSAIVVGRKLEFEIGFGKRNYFPILYKKRAGKRTDPRIGKSAILTISAETPLLFNPYTDDPTTLFSYKRPVNVDGALYTKICVGKGLDKVNRLKAVVSINLLGLNRKGLCSRRYKIRQGLKKLSQSILKDERERRDSLNRWAHHALHCSSYFDPAEGDLIGYARQIGERMPLRLHKIIKNIFPLKANAILSENPTFEELVIELKRFGDNFYDETKDYDSIDVLMDDLVD